MFRTFIALILVLSPFASFADDAHPLPSNQCYGNSCSTQQTAIWEAFEKAGPLQADAIGAVYSGACYHRASGLDAAQAHYGVIYLAEKDSQWHMGGKFAFMYEENPYRSMTPEQAAKEIPPRYTETSRVNAEDSYAWTDTNPGEQTIWQYYYRQSGSKIYVVAYWSIHHTVFCELERNQQ